MYTVRQHSQITYCIQQSVPAPKTFILKRKILLCVVVCCCCHVSHFIHEIVNCNLFPNKTYFKHFKLELLKKLIAFSLNKNRLLFCPVFALGRQRKASIYFIHECHMVLCNWVVRCTALYYIFLLCIRRAVVRRKDVGQWERDEILCFHPGLSGQQVPVVRGCLTTVSFEIMMTHLISDFSFPFSYLFCYCLCTQNQPVTSNINNLNCDASVVMYCTAV